MTQPRETDDLVEALRRALDEDSSVHPGRLRQQLETSLGRQRAHDLRRELHQVVGAAEENLPTRLARINPLTPSGLGRLSADLAEARGWSPETAERATRIWVEALGHPDLAAASWPVPPVASSRPAASIEPDLGVTAAPPEPPTPDHPVSPAQPVSWPKPRRRIGSAHAASLSGEPALGSTQAYSGMSLVVFTGGVLVLLVVLLVVAFTVQPGIAAAVCIVSVLAAGPAANLLGYGVLVATESGVEYVPYVRNLRRAKPERAYGAGWAELTVRPGPVSTMRFGDHRIQVGPLNRAFVTAAASRAGRTR